MSLYADVPPLVQDPDQWLAEEELLAEIRTGDWLDDAEFPPLRFTVEGVLPEGFAILAGAPKSGKSWLAYSIAMSCSYGGAALGCIPVAQMDVLYLTLEDGHRRVQARARQAAEGAPLPARFHYLTNVTAGRANDTIRAWLKRRTDPTNTLIIVDTITKVRPPSRANSNSYQEDYRFGAALKAISDDYPGMTLLAVHHTRKGGAADFVESSSGTNGFTGAADTIIILNRERGQDFGTLSVAGRDVDEGEYRMQGVPGGGWRLVGGSLSAAAAAHETAKASDGLGDNSAAIVAYVANNPECQPKSVTDALGLKYDMVRVTLGRLVESGRIYKTTRGRYSVVTNPPVTSVTSVTSESCEPVKVTDVTHVTGSAETCAVCRTNPPTPPNATCKSCRDRPHVDMSTPLPGLNQ